MTMVTMSRTTLAELPTHWTVAHAYLKDALGDTVAMFDIANGN